MPPKSDRDGREALLDTARELFLTSGFVAVSMQQIAEAAGMTKGAPYYHFKNKEELFLTVFLREIDRQRAGFLAELDNSDSVETGLVAAMTYVLETTRTDLFQLYSDAGRHLSDEVLAEHEILQGKKESLDTVLVPFFNDATALGFQLRVTPELASHLFMFLIMGQLHAMKHRRPASGGAPHSRQTAVELVDVFLHGVQAPRV